MEYASLNRFQPVLRVMYETGEELGHSLSQIFDIKQRFFCNRQKNKLTIALMLLL